MLASAKRRQAYLAAELSSLLDEIDDVEGDRDQWKRRLRVESTRAESLQSERDKAMGELRARFGEDAVEHAAFATAASREEEKGKGWENGESSEIDRRIPLSKIAEVLRPVYTPDGCLIDSKAVMEAARECGVDSSRDGENEEGRIQLEDFCSIAKWLRRRGTISNN